MSINHKIDFAVIFTVTNANPNGDPLDGNRPRTTLEGLGEISDVCLKRKIRNKLMDMGQNIFVQSDDRRVDDYKTLKERGDPGRPGQEQPDQGRPEYRCPSFPAHGGGNRNHSQWTDYSSH